LLSHTSEQDYAFDKLLEMICKIESIDSGGLYLTNHDNSLSLVAHIGFSKEFIESVSYFSPNSINAEIVNKGEPLYSFNLLELPPDNNIKSAAIIPIHHNEKPIGCLNLASHTHDEIPIGTKNVLESIALNLGGAIVRINSEKALKESQRNFINLFNTIKDFLFILDENGKIIDTNNFVKTKLGYTEDELKNMSVISLHPLDKKNEVIEIISDMINGKLNFCMIPIKSKDGSLIPVETKVIKGLWNQEPALFGVSRDITERLKIEEDLKIANKTKDKFFSMIAHDLRGAIGNLMQISEILLTEKRIDKELLKSQKDISENTFHLLENLLNWSRYNSEKIEIEPTKININEIFINNINMIKYQSDKKNIKIIFKKTNIFPFADKNMIDLVIRNILSNSIKFTLENGQIDIKISKKNSMVIIQISDTGIGIPKENITRILSEKEFFTTQGTLKEKGNGLGLKLCNYFIKINNGTLNIESKKNIGTKIIFSLPIFKTNN
jgi:PAS domain S-box-containing protein